MTLYRMTLIGVRHESVSAFVDVVGAVNGNHIQHDSNGNPINDPYPTAFPSCGFDLDAIGVIHQGPLGMNENEIGQFTVYPNPVESTGSIFVSSDFLIEELTLLSLSGEAVLRSHSNSLRLNQLKSGVYLLQIQTEGNKRTSKIVVR